MPDLNAPNTYAEWYWRNSLDAVRQRAIEIETTLSPFIAQFLDSIPEKDLLPPYIKSIFSAMAAPQQPEWAEGIVNTMSGLGQLALQKIGLNDLKDYEYGFNKSRPKTHITHQEANLLYQRKKIQEEFWTARNLDAGFATDEMRWNYESQRPYPNISEIIQYARYQENPDNPKDLVWKLFDVSETDYPIWEWLARMKLNTEQVLKLYREEWWNESVVDTELARLGWQLDDRRALKTIAYELPNAMLTVQGNLLRGVDDNAIRKDIIKAGINPMYAETYYDGVLTKPASMDLIAYELRKDPTLSNLSTELRKLGIHPAYHNLYRELAFPIPPVNDIITMAVREAFTPEIASRFGQYEGLPQDYVDAVQRKGISREWAERYWAAHWSLPSPQQGFEMLHRGIINRDELSLLLRALDIMPFWRERLIQMSYTPLTRVDIRRMYNLGVVNEADVNRSYQDIGYDSQNAARLTLFTVKLKQSQDKRAAEQAARRLDVEPKLWTQAQTLKFLTQKLITEDRAIAELHLLGYTDERITVYLASIREKTE